MTYPAGCPFYTTIFDGFIEADPKEIDCLPESYEFGRFFSWEGPALYFSVGPGIV